MKKIKINPEGIPMPPAPYSNVIKVEESKDMIFLSGVSATNANFEIVGKGDILAQTKQIIENVKVSLEAAGASLENIVMSTTYVLADEMDNFLMKGAANELFTAFDNTTDTLVGVAALAGMKFGAVIEVSVIAAK